MNNVTKRTSLVVATYNTHFCQDSNKIVDNICYLAHTNNVDVFCLQEVVRYPGQTFIVTKIRKRLGRNWSVISHEGAEHDWRGLGTCIVWNTEKIRLCSAEKLLLPLNSKLSCHEAIFSKLIAGESSIFQRRAIIGTFQCQSIRIQIANIHLDHVGGWHHRKKQLLYTLSAMNQNVNYAIICGDFNTFDLRHSGKEVQLLHNIFGSNYIDMSADSGWTADIYRVNFSKANPLFSAFIKGLNIHIQRKLDYIWSKGFKRISFKKNDLPGSDHLPIIAHVVAT